MAIDFSDNPKEVIDRLKANMQNSLVGSNPFTKGNLLLILLEVVGGELFQNEIQTKETSLQLFPDTATGVFLEMWAFILGVDRRGATQSVGSVTATGVLSSVIEAGKFLSASNGIVYETTEESIITETIQDITSFSFTTPTISMTTSEPHRFATGLLVTITGFNEAEANGDFNIRVTNAFNFEYDAPGLFGSPTGTPIATATFASVDVKSQSVGADTIQTNGASLTFSTSIIGVNPTAVVQGGGITGGADIESDESLKQRYLFKFRNPTTPFSKSEITQKAREVSGVTQVFFIEVPGEANVYFILGNQEDIIPPPAVVLQVREKIENIENVSIRPDGLTVAAPIPLSVDFTLANVIPGTSTMKDSIKRTLDDFFRNQQTDIGLTFSNRDLNCAINETIDFTTGEPLTDFILVSPVSVVLQPTEFAILGDVLFT